MARWGILAALAMLTLPVDPGAGAAQCDHNTSSDVAIGVSWVHATSHRCTYAIDGKTITERLERYDAFVWDPYSPSGVSAGNTVFWRSIETRWPDTSWTVVHELFAAKNETTARIAYQHASNSQQREICNVTASVWAGPQRSAAVNGPPLPACVPRLGLLP